MHSRRRKTCIFLLVMLLSACSKAPEVEPEEKQAPLPVVHVQTMKPGLMRSFSVTGEVEASRKSTIDADTKADIITVHVDIGDTVRKGQILVSLNSNTVDTRLQNAQISYDTSKLHVAQTKKINTTSIEQAQSNYDTAQINFLSLMTENNRKREQAQEMFNTSIVSKNLSVDAANTQLENELEAVHNTLTNAFAVANGIFVYSDGIKNLDYVTEVHIGARDPIATTQLRTNLEILDRKNRIGVHSYDNTMSLLTQTESAFDTALSVLHESVTSAAYTQAELTSDISALSSALSTIRNAISSLRNAQNAINTANQGVGEVSQTYIAAKALLESTLSQLDSTEVQAKRSIELAKITLENAKNQSKGNEIGAVSTLNSIASELRNAQTASQELVIRAPFDGRIQNIAVTEGDEVQAGQEVITIENTDTVTVVAGVTPEEIRTLSIGGAVLLNGNIASTITSIAPNADPITKKYNVEIDAQNESLQSGEFVTIEFSSSVPSETQRYFVPISSVHIEATDTYIWYIDTTTEETKATKKKIALGDIQGKYIEVLTGIQTGMQIITDGSRTISDDGTFVTIAQ